MTAAPVFEHVKLGFLSEPYYALVTYEDGGMLHDGPWGSAWAAERRAYHMRGAWYRDMVRTGSTGNGDECPLFPHHGRMFAMTPAAGKPPMQYCPHVDHDGRGHANERLPASRNMWPLHGFEESVEAYTARLDRAIREAGLPDLSDIEVQ